MMRTVHSCHLTNHNSLGQKIDHILDYEVVRNKLGIAKDWLKKAF